MCTPSNALRTFIHPPVSCPPRRAGREAEEDVNYGVCEGVGRDFLAGPDVRSGSMVAQPTADDVSREAQRREQGREG
jgi:hypothetical protein